MRRPVTVAVVFPAYNEEANLAPVVQQAQCALVETVSDYRLILVDDGSTDRTAAVAAGLAAHDPDHVVVVTHPHNQGYGAAVRSGIATALQTSADWILLTDADGQFDLRDIERLLATAAQRDVDLVTGYRARRADPRLRRLNASLWSGACRLLLGLDIRDIDCAFKLVRREVLETIALQGEAAVISPELLAKASRAGFRITEIPVTHYPRRAGEQSGANLRVIYRSLLGLARLRLTLTHPTVEPLPREHRSAA